MPAGADDTVVDFRPSAINRAIEKETIARIHKLLPETEFQQRFVDMNEIERRHGVSSKSSGSSSLPSSPGSPSGASVSSSSSGVSARSSGVSMPKGASSTIGERRRRNTAPSPIGASMKAAPSASQYQKASSRSRHLSLRQLLQKERRSRCRRLASPKGL